MYSQVGEQIHFLLLTVLKHTSIDSINSQPNNNTHFQIHKSSSIQVLSYGHQIKRHTKYRRRWKSSLKQKNKRKKINITFWTWQLISKQRFDKRKEMKLQVPRLSINILQQLSFSY